MATKQDNATNSSTEKECVAISRFRSCNDRDKLIEDFYEMIRSANTSVAELESVIDIYPDILESYSQNNPDCTPLHKACHYGRSKEVIELLVQKNPDMLQVADLKENLPLHIIVKKGCELSVIKLMVDTYPLSVQALNLDDQTPLHCACRNECSYEVIEYLVQSNPQALEIEDKHNSIPLHCACCHGCSHEVIELLVQENPAVLQVTDSDGNLLLHTIRQRCELSAIKLMVDTYPLSVQVQNKFDQTPLHCACENECSFPVIEYLVQLYPQALQIKDNMRGNTPFHNVCSTSCNDLSIIKLLHTAFPLAACWKNNGGYTPLAVACIRKSTKVIEYLAYKCWPLACPLLYISPRSRDAKTKKCLEDATIETVAALIDVAFHVKHILPVTVTVHVAQSVMPCVDKSKTTKSQTKPCPGQHCGLVFDTLQHRKNLDRCTLLTIMKSKELQCLLKPESGHDELQKLIDNVIQMNRAGRAYYAEDPENKRQGIKVLKSTSRGLNGLFYHIRENPLFCKRCL